MESISNGLETERVSTVSCVCCGSKNVDGAMFCKMCGRLLGKGLYAGFWTRVAAYFVDNIIITLIVFTPSMIIGMISGVFLGIMHKGEYASLAGMLIMWPMSSFVGWIYYAKLESSERQATLGKQLVRIKVVNRKGGRISFKRATARYFGMYLSFVLLFIGVLMVAFTKKRQGLHDLIAGCLMVKD